MEIVYNSFKNLLILLFSLPLFLSCQHKSFDPANPADVFERASSPYNDGLYDIALQKLGEFKSRFPYSKHAINAELMIADSHFQLGNYQDSAFAYEQFVKLHPRHNKVAFALYRIGESYWIEAPEDIDREQDFTRRALTKWNNLLKQFPKSSYSKEAKEKISLGERRIAASQVFVMDFYCKQAQFHSCAYKALIILDKFKHFPDVKQKALERAAEAFEELAEQKEDDPNTDENLYVKSMSLKELKQKASTFRRLSGS